MKFGLTMWRMSAATVACCAALCCAADAAAQTRKKHTTAAKSSASHPPHAAASSHKSSAHAQPRSSHKAAPSRAAAHGKHYTKAPAVAATAESRRLSSAFTASSQLRPMAQQLAATRSAAAYSGVRSYAASHTGEASAAAYIALGHAAQLDHNYSDAQRAYAQAAASGDALDDYADYLGAQSALQAGHANDAIQILSGFTQKHPNSLFVPNVPTALANAYLANNDAADAIRVLSAVQGTPAANKVDFRSTLARANQMRGNTAEAARLYRGIYLGDPIAPEAQTARTQLQAMNVPLTAAESKQHADALYNAKQYTLAAQEYRALQKNDASLSQADRDALEIYAAVCDLRLKRLSHSDVSHLPVTGDDSAALKLYLDSELARNDNDFAQHDIIVSQLEQQYPHSRWLEEALYSGGNMYLVKGDMANAESNYERLVDRFPRSTYAPSSHWHAAWLSYRLRRFSDAARLMDEQIQRYPAGSEVPGALYWRARLYEDVEHNLGQAENYYQALSASYINSYYAMLGRQRLAVIQSQAQSVPPPAALAGIHPVEGYRLTADLPENDVHLIKARLLANASLNEYIRPELQLGDPNNEWSAFAEAQIYQSFGENTRALQAMKRAKIPFFSLPVSNVPMEYWQIVFPRPYWSQLTADAQEQGVDPYLVAALIRQESEFNPGAVSHANAYGLMQLIPSTGKAIAKRRGMRHFQTSMLLDPSTNLALGVEDLHNSIAKYGGQVEYALASYNAGDTPIRRWINMGGYKDIPEWVESIPYTETREYVQAIIRNREMYRAIYSGR
ncbi:transglycosylase SLT domain-containing protein [Granulicella cerasi]|uniref:Transglycosylase SLT domain-containing protein n=1 Tax=Granulicella cerasi TaxID=741063 RepID=A0ABW1Z4P0_9BACT|nr:transglycosylase SLT domain-containing protein [Granulicella cerasi]